MRLLKILTIFILVLVTALYGITAVTRSLRDKTDSPTISCAGDVLELSVTDDESVLMEGVTASDKQDGDLTHEIMVSGISKFLDIGTSTATYLVFDSDHNVGSLTRTIRYTDYESPRFTITEPLIYKSSEDIVLLDRISVVDCIDGDITGNVRVSSLDASTVDEVYTTRVQVTNSMGDSAELTLPIVWLTGNSDRPDIVLTDYLVYVSQGSSFNANSYLSYVSTPDGTGSRSDVRIENNVDTSEPGVYYVYYTYSHKVSEGSSLKGISVLTVVVE